MVTLPTPWQALPPAPFAIPYFAWTGSPDVRDPLTGNTIESWATAVQKHVQGWDMLTSEHLPAMEVEQKFEVFLCVPPHFMPNIRDRFGLPLPSNHMSAPVSMFDETGRVSPGVFEVVGHDMENFSFMLWNPGNIILLKDIE